jgi:hypothetical protein
MMSIWRPTLLTKKYERELGRETTPRVAPQATPGANPSAAAISRSASPPVASASGTRDVGDKASGSRRRSRSVERLGGRIWRRWCFLPMLGWCPVQHGAGRGCRPRAGVLRMVRCPSFGSSSLPSSVPVVRRWLEVAAGAVEADAGAARGHRGSGPGPKKYRGPL